MATVHASYGKARAIDGVSIWQGTGRTETITSSGTAASGALTANGNEIVKVSCATAIIVSADGASASSSHGTYVDAGIPEYFALGDGFAISVIDA